MARLVLEFSSFNSDVRGSIKWQKRGKNRRASFKGETRSLKPSHGNEISQWFWKLGRGGLYDQASNSLNSYSSSLKMRWRDGFCVLKKFFKRNYSLLLASLRFVSFRLALTNVEIKTELGRVRSLSRSVTRFFDRLALFDDKRWIRAEFKRELTAPTGIIDGLFVSKRTSVDTWVEYKMSTRVRAFAEGPIRCCTLLSNGRHFRNSLKTYFLYLCIYNFLYL